MNTTENNKIIAEFLGYIKHETNFTKGKNKVTYKLLNPNTPNGLPLIKIYEESTINKLHSDWNWLMEVAEKIESLGYNTKIESLEHTRVSIGNGKYLTLVEVDNETKIQAVYNACIEFIKWYNENKI